MRVSRATASPRWAQIEITARVLTTIAVLANKIGYGLHEVGPQPLG